MNFLMGASLKSKFIEISGRVTSGKGLAVETIPKQYLYLVQHFPEIYNIHKASINVRLNVPVVFMDWDFTSPPIAWREDGCTERFSFRRILFQVDHSIFKAWIYHPHKSSNSYDPYLVEIVLPHIDIEINSKCNIFIYSKSIIKDELIVVN